MTQPDDFLTAMESTRDRLVAAVGGATAALRRSSPRGVDGSWRTAANILAVVLVVATVAPFVVHAVPALIGAEHSYVVTSGSMEPAIGVGSVVMVEDVDPDRIERGDVITFTSGDAAQPTTHRVVEVVEREDGVAFRTKGDANEDPDQGLVTPEQVEGRVMSVGGYLLVVPYIGYAIAFANTRTGYAAMVVVPIALLILNEFYNLVSGGDGGSAGQQEPQLPAPDDDPADGSDPIGWPEDPAAPAGAASTAADDGASPEPGIEDQPAAGSDDGATYTLEPAELQFGAVVLAAFAGYSIWVAYNQTAVWSTGVAGAVSVALILAAGLYLSGGSDSPDGADGPASAGGSGPATAGRPAASTAPGAPAGAADGTVPSDPATERPGERRRDPGSDTQGTPAQSSAAAGRGQERAPGGGGAAAEAAAGDVLIRQHRPEEAVAGMDHQPVGSFATLVNMAASTGQPIYQDPDWEAHYLVGKEILYVHQVYDDEDARPLSTAEDSRDPAFPPGESADEDLDGRGHDSNSSNPDPNGPGQDPDHESDDPFVGDTTSAADPTRDGRHSNGTDPWEGSDG